MEHLCKCLNCGRIMYDENPDPSSEKLDASGIEDVIYPMELLNDEGDSYWGCGECGTDSYLIDL